MQRANGRSGWRRYRLLLGHRREPALPAVRAQPAGRHRPLRAAPHRRLAARGRRSSVQVYGVDFQGNQGAASRPGRSSFASAAPAVWWLEGTGTSRTWIASLPAAGVAILGANAQGKTNLLEAIYYPVLFRSFRGSPGSAGDAVRGPGFMSRPTSTEPRPGPSPPPIAGRKKRITVDGRRGRAADRCGRGPGSAVAFLPADLASPRDRRGAAALSRPAAVAGRPRSTCERSPDTAPRWPSATARCGRAGGARRRVRWAAGRGGRRGRAAPAGWVSRCRGAVRRRVRVPGRARRAALRYRGQPTLADAGAWDRGTGERAPRRSGSRDDHGRAPPRRPGARDRWPPAPGLRLDRPAAERRDRAQADRDRACATARGTEPALLLDDVFAELDRERQTRLALRLLGREERQVFVTSPRTRRAAAEFGSPGVAVMDGGVRVSSGG